MTPPCIDLPQIQSTPQDCPRWHSCNAALCPLDPHWRGTHLSGEQVCKLLLDSGKAGSAERYASDPVFAAAVAKLPEIAQRYPDIGKKVAIAAKSGFREDNLARKPRVQADSEASVREVTPSQGV